MRALNRLEVDARGPRRDGPALSSRCIAENYGGGPVGVETLAAALSEQRDAIEEVIEPYPDPAAGCCSARRAAAC